MTVIEDDGKFFLRNIFSIMIDRENKVVVFFFSGERISRQTIADSGIVVKNCFPLFLTK